MLINIISFAEETAFEAGKIILKGFRSKSTVINQKSSTNLVTSMDIASEKFIVGAIKKKFPAHTIIAEEGGGFDKGKDFIWYIDPIDGTNNYAHGIQNFAVSIGIFSKELNLICAGVVYDPYHNEMFKAFRGSGAYLNGEQIDVSKTEKLGNAIIATGFPYEKNDPASNNSIRLAKILPKLRDIRRLGAASLDLCYVACGRLDGYWESTLQPWDSAAGSLIVEEAGGRVTRFSGEKYQPEKDDVIASNGLIHKEIMKYIKP
jgi:myo-inositol-1(or 4)-monophosphatase